MPAWSGPKWREDRDAPAEAGIIVSYEFWRRSMASALPLSRVPITVDDRTYTVVGVLPAKLEGSMVFMAMSRPS